ncbi:hypothetical protein METBISCDRAFT_28151 [Metschnikowia bicuspidata]|uniref:Uncharacterized protein n=1 Tax=Metschnikowia bicuspidata TaxID=27322 RepID=A0A4P9Z9V3_9ASCO|nr:hypothetical protein METBISCDRAFT_28151 [Metschnikowia bicuspidata]
MDELTYVDNGSSIAKSLACLADLEVLGVPNAAAWTAFLTLHPLIRRLLLQNIRASLKDPLTVHWVSRLYRNKHWLVFPLLNHRYLLGAIKNWRSLNWRGLARAYTRHNAFVALYLLTTNFQAHVLAQLDYTKPQPFNRDVRALARSHLVASLHRGNAVTNRVYDTSVWSMLFSALTLPFLSAGGVVQQVYRVGRKTFIKNYLMVLGALSALLAMWVNLCHTSAACSGPSWLAALYLSPEWFNAFNA